MLAASDGEDSTPLLSGKKAKAVPQEVREDGREGTRRLGLDTAGWGKMCRGTRPRPSHSGLTGAEAHREGQSARHNMNLQQSPGIARHNPGLPTPVSPLGWGEGAHTAPQAPGAPRRQPSCAGH